MSGRSARRARRRIKSRYVDRFLRAYITVLRRILKRRGIPEGEPSPCHTCAFNPGTDSWRGFQSTVTRVMESVEQGRPFLCHEGLPTRPDGNWYLPTERQPLWNPKTGEVTWPAGVDPPKLCAGFEAVKDDPDTARAPLLAIRELPEPPPGLLRKAKRRAGP